MKFEHFVPQYIYIDIADLYQKIKIILYLFHFL